MKAYPKPYRYTVGAYTKIRTYAHTHIYIDYTHMRRYVESSVVSTISYVVSGYGGSSVCLPVGYVGSIPELDLFAYAKSRIVWADGELDLAVRGILDEAKDKLGILNLPYVV